MRMRPGVTAVAAVTAIAIMGCNATQRGALIGAGAGAGAGALIGHAVGATAEGAIIGAAVGGAAGAIIGRQMDRQKNDIENSVEGATVTRVGEGLVVTFDSGLLYGFNSSELQPDARTNLTNLANSLKRFDNTDVLIVGHTDSIGSAQYNMGLSERRANSAADYLAVQGIDRSRMRTSGRGETEPIADNAMDSGRQLNRRVEIVIVASEEFREEASRS